MYAIKRSNTIWFYSHLLVNTRFSERVFIPHPKTRNLLQQFCSKGISPADFRELTQLISHNVPSMIALMDYMKAESNMSSVTLMPPKLWCGLVTALATPSPVCALVHPSERLFSLLERMKSEDITVDPEAMQTLQQEMPVLFELLRLLKYVPTKVLSPLIAALIEKSAAPFSSGSDHSVASVNASKMEPLSFFPQLPSIWSRGTYAADRTNTTPKICTKRSTGHPTLLPGIFTLFCQHG